MATFAPVEIVAFPPLGDTTCLPSDAEKVDFSVILRFDRDGADGAVPDPKQFQVGIWHNCSRDRTWTSSPLLLSPVNEVDTATNVLFIRGDKTSVWLRYSGSVPRPDVHPDGPVSFTVRYRHGATAAGSSDGTSRAGSLASTTAPAPSPSSSTCPQELLSAWDCPVSHLGADSGDIIFPRPADSLAGEFDDFFSHTSSDISVERLTPCTSKPALVWKATTAVEAATGSSSTWASIPIGRPTKAGRWFALERLSTPWLVPNQGDGHFTVDRDVLMAAFERHDGRHVVIVPMSGLDLGATTILRSGDDGVVQLKARNDEPVLATATVLVAVADSFEIASAAAVYACEALTRQQSGETAPITIDRQAPPMASLEPPAFSPDSAGYNEISWFDYLTYCTWNSLGNQVTAEKIITGLNTLKDAGIEVSHLIIDDNWQDLEHGGRLIDFEANKTAFPHGLKVGLAKIREAFPNVVDISMWHTIIGYWSGLSPDGALAKRYKTRWVNRKRGDSDDVYDSNDIDGWLVFDKPDVGQAYSDFFGFLADCGATSVKTDFQCSLDMITHPAHRCALIQSFQTAWLSAIEKHFSGRGIACMAMAPTLMFASQLNSGHRPIPVRSSDDYFPNIDDSHGWHVWVNAHNSVLVSLLNAVPDWDMFQSKHEWAEVHAAARAISGGPVTLTDTPGCHDVDLVRKLVARTQTGVTVSLRPSGKGVAPMVYSRSRDRKLLRIRNYVVGPHVLVHLLALIHIDRCTDSQRGPISEMVRLSDIIGSHPSSTQQWIVRGSHSGTIFGPTSASTASSTGDILISLQPKGWEILSAHAVYVHPTAPELRVAPLGLTGKFTGAAALAAAEFDASPSRLQIRTQLRASVMGQLGFWIDGLAGMDWQDRVMAEVNGTPIGLDAVVVGREDPSVLELDVQKVMEGPAFAPRKETWVILTIRLG